MKYLIFSILLITSFLFTNNQLSDLQTYHYIAPTPPVIHAKLTVVKRKTPTPNLLALINKKATEYNVSADLITRIISCESGFVETARGDGGYSRGLVQIHSVYHPEVSYDQAVNPEFAVDFLAKNLAEGKGGQWTCYRMITQR